MNKAASVHTIASPTVAELVDRARALAPLLRKNAAASEANRRVEEETIQAMKKAGLMRVCTPKRYGGWEMNTRAMLEVSSAIAEGDGAAAWVANLNNVCCWLTSLFSRKAQDEVFGDDPDTCVSGVLNPTATVKKEPGGYRIVSGTWHYNSGGWHAQWAVLGLPIVNDAGEPVDQGLAMIPMSDLEREDTWFVAGMKATGSIALHAKNVFIPAHRILSVPQAIEGKYPTEMQDEAFYRSAFVALLSIILVGPILGLGRAALEFVRTKASSRTIAYTFFEKQTASVAFQLQLADAALMIDTAHFHAFRAADDVDQAAARGVYPDMLTRARVRADTGYTVEKITQAIDKLLFAHGSAGFAEASPLQRIWRDAAVASRHAVALPPIGYELYGKALLGVKNDVTPLI
jgi:alkylation response protein AidB-like acyl-CoA dehydrogenase